MAARLNTVQISGCDISVSLDMVITRPANGETLAYPGKEGWLITSDEGYQMIIEKDVSVRFNSQASTTEEIQKELNDIKAILLSVALKLDEDARQQLVKELLTIPSESIKQWAGNLHAIGKR